MISKDIHKRKKSFFEGWYFKHQYDNFSISLIPGINISKDGKKYSFIQVITNNDSYNIKYKFEDFSISNDRLTIKIKDNIFSKSGVILNIKDSDVKIKAQLKYDNITPIRNNIMGPFSLIKFMECNHDVISLYHEVNGILSINNKEIKINNGTGYIEKDYGTSFPKTYLWVHCNDFKNEKVSVMVSIADIPFLGFEFKGCIASILYKEKEYRMATYNGVRIIDYNKNGLTIKRGSYKLHIDIESNNRKKLFAPNKGEMERVIYESIACNGRFRFYKKDELIFDLKSNNTSFEYVN